MKKFALLFAIVLPMAFASCSNDDPVTLDPTDATIDYGQTVTIKASNKGGSWKSSNDFVAKVEGGVVTGMHVGQATIQYKKDESTALCTIMVNPTNNNYPWPCTDFGASVETVKWYMNRLGGYTLVLDENTVLGYATTATNGFPLYVYTFDEGALFGCSISVLEDDGADLLEWVEQYFAEVAETETGWIYADAYSILDSNNAVVFEPNVEAETWQAIFLPVDHSKAGFNSTVAQHKAIVKQILAK